MFFRDMVSFFFVLATACPGDMARGCGFQDMLGGHSPLWIILVLQVLPRDKPR